MNANRIKLGRGARGIAQVGDRGIQRAGTHLVDEHVAGRRLYDDVLHDLGFQAAFVERPLREPAHRALFFVTDAAEEREAALERRLQNRVRQLKLATWPDGTVLGGPDRATGDPRAVKRLLQVGQFSSVIGSSACSRSSSAAEGTGGSSAA